jgi:autotransporter-associated beta strand protein
LTKTGGGVLTLSTAENTYIGGTTVSGGTLSIDSGLRLGSPGTGKENLLSGGILQLTGAATYGNAWTLGSGSNTIKADADAVLGGDLSGSGGFTKSGAEDLMLSDTANNTYTGATTVGEGKLIGNIAYNTVLTVEDDATYDGLGADHTLGALYGGTDALVTDSCTGTCAGTLTVKMGNFSGTMEGDSDLVKTTTEALTLGGAVTRKDVTLDEGRLNIKGSLTTSGVFKVSSDNDTVLGIKRKNDNSAVITAGSAVIAATAPDVGVVLDILNYAGSDKYVLIHTDDGISGRFNEVRAGGNKIVTPGPDGKIEDVTEEKFLIVNEFPFLSEDGKDLVVQTDLIWKQMTDAHGTFNVLTDFSVDWVLKNNEWAEAAGDALREEEFFGWDGTHLTKTGVGTLTLTAANEYTGGTTLYEGTLSIASDDNLGKLAVGKENRIEGGVLQLTGTDPYAQNWTLGVVDTGKTNTIEVANAGNIASFQGELSGDGGLTKIGAGTTLILGGDNRYPGGTFIEAGTIIAGSNTALGGGTATMENETTLGFSGDYTLGNAFTLNGGASFDTDDETGNYRARLTQVIDGAGRLTKVGQGALILDGDNSYAGGTSIETGAIIAGSNTALGAKDGAVTMGNETTLGFSGDYTLENAFILNDEAIFDTDDETGNYRAGLTNAVDGAGSLTKVGAGKLTLAGKNTYTGGTAISAGILAITGSLGDGERSGDLEKFEYSGTFDNADTLVFDQSAKEPSIRFEQILNGAMTGSGALEKYGTGILILNDPANTAATVRIDGGSLLVGGTSGNDTAQLTAGKVEVGKDARLGGHGMIFSADADATVVVHEGGILSPGNSYGTFTIKTRTFFESGSLFEVEVNPNDAREGDRLIVEGAATLTGGVVSHVGKYSPAGDYLGKEWLILSADEFVGKFDKVVSDLLDLTLTPKLRYADEKGGDDVDDTLYLSFTREGTGGGGEGGGGENGGGENGGGETEAEWRRTGDAHTALQGNLVRLDDAFMRRLLRHVGAKSAQSAWRGRTSGAGDDLWIGVNQTYQAADGNAGRARLNGTEIAGGHDAVLDDGWLAGLAFRFGTARQDADSRRSEADIVSSTAALYGGRERPLGSGTLRVLFSGALTRHEVDSKRRVGIDSRKLERKFEASYAGTAFVGAFETAYRVSPTEKLSMEPYASVAWHSLHLDGFREKGGSGALKKKGETRNHATSTLGMRLSTSPRARVSFDADVGWQHLYGNAAPKSTFYDGSDKFRIQGAALNKDAAILGLSVGVKVAKDAKISFQYDGEWGGKGQSHAGQVVFEMRW